MRDIRLTRDEAMDADKIAKKLSELPEEKRSTASMFIGAYIDGMLAAVDLDKNTKEPA